MPTTNEFSMVRPYEKQKPRVSNKSFNFSSLILSLRNFKNKVIKEINIIRFNIPMRIKNVPETSANNFTNFLKVG